MNAIYRTLRKLIQSRKPTPHAIFAEVKSQLDSIQPSSNSALSEVAHARPALAIKPPGLFRHVLFFFPFRENDPKEVLHPGQFERDEAVEEIVLLLKKIIHSKECSICRPEAVNSVAEWETNFKQRKGLVRDETFILTLDGFLGFEFRLAVDIYSEYATITFVLDNHELLKTRSQETPPDIIADYVRERILASSAIKAKQRFREMTPSEIVYFGVWDLLGAEWEFRIEESKIGSIFGDFRGFAVCPVNYPASQADLKPGELALSPNGIRLQPDQDVSAYLNRYAKFFLSCIGLNDQGTSLHGIQQRARMEPNIILCKMLGGDAIYGSALGSKFAYEHIDRAPVPIAYFVIYNGRSADQLGRMIRRQHLLGELRLAALLDVETIARLGGPVRKLGGLVFRLLSYGTRFRTVGPREFEEAVNLYIQMGRKCHGGLLYRLARANYYYEALEARLDDTRSEAIRGWQSYNAFIKRHFDQRFRSMRSIGQRYIDVGVRIERLLAIFAAEKQRIFSLTPLSIALLSVLLSIISSIYWPTESRFGWITASVIAMTILLIFVCMLYVMLSVLAPKEIARILTEVEEKREND